MLCLLFNSRGYTKCVAENVAMRKIRVLFMIKSPLMLIVVKSVHESLVFLLSVKLVDFRISKHARVFGIQDIRKLIYELSFRLNRSCGSSALITNWFCRFLVIRYNWITLIHIRSLTFSSDVNSWNLNKMCFAANCGVIGNPNGWEAGFYRKFRLPFDIPQIKLRWLFFGKSF